MKKIDSLLLIDDNIAINRLNQTLAEDLEVATCIYIAENGQQALELIAKKYICPDLIITDINMPIMDGLAFLAAYNQLPNCQQQSNIIISSDTSCPIELTQIATFDTVKEQLEKPISAATWQRLKMTYGV